MGVKLQLLGKRFGRLVVTSESKDRFKDKAIRWNCSCDCGGEKLVNGRDLKRKSVQSCGCLHKDVITKHGLVKYPLYNVWKSMLARCYSNKTASYKYYGKRGITVCDEWRNVSAFIGWAKSKGYKKGLQIDRINNNGNYEPSNCRFVTPTENANNTRANLIVKVYGHSMTLADACRKYNASYDVATQRINKLGWSAERSLTQPVRVLNRRKQ